MTYSASDTIGPAASSKRERMQKPRVIIADDHRLVADALKELLAPACNIITTVYDGDSLLEETRRHHPDIITLDISMPPQRGLAPIQQLRKIDSAVRIVVVTMNHDPDVAAEALRLGASAYVLKSSAPSELLEAIRHPQDGYVTPLVARGVITSLAKPNQTLEVGKITQRQREVLRLLAEGSSMKQAAAALNLTVTTVAFHKYRMMKALNITTSAELIRFAVTHHIVSD
jgi:DNA-binding NarL/FixJ family response regulator